MCLSRILSSCFIEQFWEDLMKAYIATLAGAIVTAGAAYAANETVTMNMIDANGVGKN